MLDFNAYNFSFSDNNFPDWENELGVSDTNLVSFQKL